MIAVRGAETVQRRSNDVGQPNDTLGRAGNRDGSPVQTIGIRAARIDVTLPRSACAAGLYAAAGADGDAVAGPKRHLRVVCQTLRDNRFVDPANRLVRSVGGASGGLVRSHGQDRHCSGGQ